MPQRVSGLACVEPPDSHGVNPLFYKNLGYGSVKDFAPIGFDRKIAAVAHRARLGPGAHRRRARRAGARLAMTRNSDSPWYGLTARHDMIMAAARFCPIMARVLGPTARRTEGEQHGAS